MIDIANLRSIKTQLEGEKGPFVLFGLFLRENSPGKWDLVVAAPWLHEDKYEDYKIVSDKLSAILPQNQMIDLSRIVILNEGNPGLSALLHAVHVAGNGYLEVRDSNFFGLSIRHAHILAAEKLEKVSSSPTAG